VGLPQVLVESDWYMNYATGERILWRTTGWEYNKDYTQLTWHVRKGVTWNDGMPYTAQDIVYTFNLWLHNPDLGGSATAEDLASATAPDDYTVIFTLKAPDPRWHTHLMAWGPGYGAIVAKHVYEKVDVRTYRNWPPVETGPYKLLNYYSDLSIYVWQADPNYWGTRVMGKKPGPRYVVFRKAPPPDLDLQEFVQGNVDMPLPHIFPIDMVRAAQKQWTHTVLSPYMDAVSSGIASFNTARAPTSDRDFRWALQFLLNREKLRRIYPMADSTAVTMWPWPDWTPMRRWEAAAVRAKYGSLLRYDPAEAARRLDTLGYKKGSDGLRKTPDGKPFTIVLVANPPPDFGSLVAGDFADELRKVGIDNALKPFGAGITDQQFSKGEYDVSFDAIDGSAAFSSDPLPMIDSFGGKWAKPLGEVQLGGDWGKSRLNDPALDAMNGTLARMNPDDPKYIDAVAQAMDRWFYDLPAVPAVEKTFVQVMSDKYWTNWPVPGHMYQVPYQWWPTLPFILFEIKPVK
jgi:peptide/nickel transport system substrate-binding protein